MCHYPQEDNHIRATIEAYERSRIGNTPEELPPDPEGMNDQRAAAGESALIYFADKHGERAGGEEQNLAELLVDLAHYCDRNSLNLAAIWERAATHYNEETDNQGEQMDTIPSSYSEPESESECECEDPAHIHPERF